MSAGIVLEGFQYRLLPVRLITLPFSGCPRRILIVRKEIADVAISERGVFSNDTAVDHTQPSIWR